MKTPPQMPGQRLVEMRFVKRQPPGLELAGSVRVQIETKDFATFVRKAQGRG